MLPLQSGSILPLGLISGASLLLTILSSSSPPVPTCHWPPTSGVVATLGTGENVGSYLKERMFEAERHGPRSFGGGGIGIGKRRRG
jgi:hypothetical protein